MVALPSLLAEVENEDITEDDLPPPAESMSVVEVWNEAIFARGLLHQNQKFPLISQNRSLMFFLIRD